MQRLLRVPLADLHDPITVSDEDFPTLFQNVPKLIESILTSIRLEYPDSVTILIDVLFQASIAHPAHLESVLKREDRAVQWFGEVLEKVASSRGNATALSAASFVVEEPTQVQLLSITQQIALSQSLKELLPDSVFQSLVQFLARPIQYFQLSRLSAGCLIALASKSPHNRKRQLIYAPEYAKVVESSCDVYLQMQVVELLYRLKRDDSDKLIERRCAKISTILSQLKNDATFVDSLFNQLIELNKGRNDMLGFDFVRIDDSTGKALGESNVVFFNQEFMCAALSVTPFVDLTVRYVDVRSVRTTKDMSLVCRLAQFCETLQDRCGPLQDASNDSITIRFTSAVFLKVRNGPISGWISARKSGNAESGKTENSVPSDESMRSSSSHKKASPNKRSRSSGVEKQPDLKDRRSLHQFDEQGLEDRITKDSQLKAEAIEEHNNTVVDNAVQVVQRSIDVFRQKTADDIAAMEQDIMQHQQLFVQSETQCVELLRKLFDDTVKEFENLKLLHAKLLQEINEASDSLNSVTSDIDTEEMELLEKFKESVDKKLEATKSEMKRITWLHHPILAAFGEAVNS